MFVSTRSGLEVRDVTAILQGIAPDGGLFVCPEIEPIDVPSLLNLSYTEMAEKIMSHLLPGFTDVIPTAVAAYPVKFDDPEITPVRPVGDKFVLELWHGPTSAFKDLALTILPYLVSAAKDMEGVQENVSILTATSGDTGKAALEGFHDVPGTDITVFFPDGGVSDTQRLQMVTQEGGNVRVFAVRGNFDDCQRGVKEAFAANQGKKYLSSANSINIGRLVPQVVYYFYAYAKVGHGEERDFVVPTGNFGDILAGYLAKKMGLPIGKLICASNANNVLYDFLNTGVYDRRRPFLKTASPSMDILVSSNLERLLYYASGCDCAAVAAMMKQLNEEGCYSVSDAVLAEIRKDFSAAFCSEDSCLETIGRVWKEYGYLMDTHTAVAFANAPAGSIVLSTASPFKFSDAVSKAIGMNLADTGVKMPANLANLDKRPVLHTDVINTEEIVRVALS